MSAPRPPKGKKPFPDNNNANIGSRGSRGPAWRTSGSQNFANAARQNTQFPPLSGGQQRSETGYDPKLLATLASATGQTIVLTLKSQARHEGVVGGTISGGEPAGVTLKDCRDLGNPQSPIRESMLFPASDILSWAPAPARMSNGTDKGFRTDTDISNSTNTAASRERELQQWQPDASSNEQANNISALQGDEATFGPAGGYSGVPWDQFEVNEQLFGVTTKFDEDAYTTKLDRSAPGFKERERKAAQLANEIMSNTTSNPHVAEERVMNGTENGIGEEEKFSAVVRSAGAYVPPGARRNGTGPPAQPNNAPSNPQSANPPTSPVPAVTTNGTVAATTAAAQPSGNANSEEGAAKPPAEGLVANFRDFVTSEKARLEKRKQAMVKTEMDKRKADLLKFSKSFKLSKPIPEDLLPILAKSEEKQKAIIEKANADVVASQTKVATKEATSGPSSSKAPNSQESASKSAIKPAPTADGPVKKTKGSVYIQPIPPFNKDKTRKTGAPTAGTTAQAAAGTNSTAPTVQTTPASPTAAKAPSNLNANASVFRPNANAPVFKPSSPAATPPPPKAKEPTKEPAAPAAPPNPFYGTRVPTKKGAVVNIKDDFNPFRHSKVLDASQISSIWPYSGKRFLTLYPNVPMHIPPGPNIPTPQIPGPPPPPYEEDPTSQPGPAQRQIPQQQQPPPQQQQPQYPVMYYPQYPYSPAPHGQPPMMMQTPPQFMPGPYMHPVPYPHHMPPNTPMYGHPSPAMQGVPPTPHYMPHQPYPQTSPPPTGTPRGPGPMPPQQMPHGYYHPSPQMTHAMPYQMMMPPPQPGPHFDPNGQGPPPVAPQPTQMGH